MNRIRSGDTVLVNAGKNKGLIGKVLKVIQQKVIVEGANLIKKHVKPNPQLEQRGGIVSKEAFIHISNVSIYNSESKKADRIGFKFIEKDGVTVKVRYFKSNGQLVDNL